MSRRVDARDVLDPNGRTRTPFTGRIVGHYRPTGPNAWDDYELVRREEGTIRVLGGIKVQLERHGATFRMRRDGRVVRVRWEPTAAELAEAGSATPRSLRRLFLARYIADFGEEAGRGAAAVVASKLRD
jgi:hypothetical protein